MLGKYGDLFWPPSILTDVYMGNGDGSVFETGLMKLFDLFKFVINVGRV